MRGKQYIELGKKLKSQYKMGRKMGRGREEGDPARGCFDEAIPLILFQGLGMQQVKRNKTRYTLVLCSCALFCLATTPHLANKR
jgi:hypothetical protein